MPLSVLFWLLMILWLILGVAWPAWKCPPEARVGHVGGVLLFAVIACLGWRVFGEAIQG